jgi:hypothetical protein
VPDTPTLVARILFAAAIALATLFARHRPAHRPIAAGLALALALDLVVPHLALSARADLAAYLLTPAISAWVALRVLATARPAAAFAPFAVWAGGALLVGRAPSPELWWAAAPRLAHGAALAVEAWTALAWWRSPARAELPQRCALVLAAGDFFGMLGPLGVGGPWEIVNWQAAIFAALLIGLHTQALLELRRQRRAEADRSRDGGKRAG